MISSIHRPAQHLLKKTIGRCVIEADFHRVSAHANVSRALFSSGGSEPFLPRITERRLNEAGAGGRSSNAGVKVAIFGATGFLGKHLCNQIGMLAYFVRWDESWIFVVCVCVLVYSVLRFTCGVGNSELTAQPTLAEEDPVQI
jgi:hypothetical protein